MYLQNNRKQSVRWKMLFFTIVCFLTGLPQEQIKRQRHDTLQVSSFQPSLILALKKSKRMSRMSTGSKRTRREAREITPEVLHTVAYSSIWSKDGWRRQQICAWSDPVCPCLWICVANELFLSLILNLVLFIRNKNITKISYQTTQLQAIAFFHKISKYE